MQDEMGMLAGAAVVALLIFIVVIRQRPDSGLIAGQMVSAAISAAFALPVPGIDGWGRSAMNAEIPPALVACLACIVVAAQAKNATPERRSALAVGVVLLAIATGAASLVYGAFTLILMAFRAWKLVLIPGLIAAQLASVIQAGRQA